MKGLEISDEDNIDTETLQAQIDLSMSFAQDLVSSWLKPQKLSTNSRRRNFETELREYMRRPPRLGVGAPVPDTQANSREVARLKGQLAGKKRGKVEDEDNAKQQGSDTEEESRTGAIKRKARDDPFDVLHGKKKKNNGKANGVLTPSPTPFAAVKSSQPEIGESLPKRLNKIAGESMVNSPKPSEKGREKTAKQLQRSSPNSPKREGLNLSAVFSPTTPSSLSSNPPSESKTSNTPSSRPDAAEPTGMPMPALLSTTPTPTPRVHLPPQLLNESLLNLEPLLSEAESDDALPATPSTSPKRKRKRSRKKKNPLRDNSAPFTTPIS